MVVALLSSGELARAGNGDGIVSTLVMGDSYSAGNGAGEYYGPKGCYRSSRNYGREFQRALERTGQRAFVETVACSGAVTNDFFGRQKGQRAQIHAVNHGYDLILLTVGGNDAGFGGIATHCLVKPTRSAKDCAPRLSAAREIVTGDYQGRNLERRIRGLLTAIHEDSHPQAKIALLGYPYLEADPGYTLGNGPGGRPVQVGREIRELGRLGDAMQQRAVQAVNRAKGGNKVIFVSTKALFAGQDPSASGGTTQGTHEVYANYRNPNRWLVAPGEDLTASLQTYYHPNPQGWHEEGELLFRDPRVPKSDPAPPGPPTAPAGPARAEWRNDATGVDLSAELSWQVENGSARNLTLNLRGGFPTFDPDDGTIYNETLTWDPATQLEAPRCSRDCHIVPGTPSGGLRDAVRFAWVFRKPTGGSGLDGPVTLYPQVLITYTIYQGGKVSVVPLVLYVTDTKYRCGPFEGNNEYASFGATPDVADLDGDGLMEIVGSDDRLTSVFGGPPQAEPVRILGMTEYGLKDAGDTYSGDSPLDPSLVPMLAQDRDRLWTAFRDARSAAITNPTGANVKLARAYLASWTASVVRLETSDRKTLKQSEKLAEAGKFGKLRGRRNTERYTTKVEDWLAHYPHMDRTWTPPPDLERLGLDSRPIEPAVAYLGP